MMTPREAVTQGVEAVARHYPNFSPTHDGQLRALIDDYVQDLDGFPPEAIVAGFNAARREAGKFKPVPADILACVKRMHKVQMGSALPVPVGDPDAICVACGTQRLGLFVDRLEPDGMERLYPIHASGCAVFLSERLIHVSQVRRREAA